MPSQPEDHEALPRRTTPTWEVELLLSGATVFAMVQLALALPAWSAYLLPRLDVEFEQITRLMFVYANGAVLLLVLTFVLHLGMRAYWVGLVGLNSVYPGGVKWEGLRAGPIARERLKQRLPDVAEAIERADNRATLVFGVGIGMALIFVPLMLVVAVMYAAAAAIAWLAGAPGALTYVFVGLLLLMLLPYLGALSVDRVLGDRLAPGSLLRRATAAIIGAYSATGMARESNPLMTLYSSNVGERRGGLTVGIVMVVALGMTWLGVDAVRDELGPGSFAAFPDPRPGMADSVHGHHYASRRDTLSSPDLPYIPDLVSTGKYLRLVVPYVPGQHSHLLRGCGTQPQADQASDRERATRTARRDCLASGFEVRVDGEPVTVPPDWYTEPRRDLRGLLYMIPVETLATGRHELTVLSKPAPGPKRKERPAPHVIPFWR